VAGRRGQGPRPCRSQGLRGRLRRQVPKASAKITDDLEELLALCDYPCKRWVHLARWMKMSSHPHRQPIASGHSLRETSQLSPEQAHSLAHVGRPGIGLHDAIRKAVQHRSPAALDVTCALAAVQDPDGAKVARRVPDGRTPVARPECRDPSRRLQRVQIRTTSR
jgi:hypothetical protein